jgi:hypothetical protein
MHQDNDYVNIQTSALCNILKRDFSTSLQFQIFPFLCFFSLYIVCLVPRVEVGVKAPAVALRAVEDREPNGWGHKWNSLSLGNINIGTQPTRLDARLINLTL